VSDTHADGSSPADRESTDENESDRTEGGDPTRERATGPDDATRATPRTDAVAGARTTAPILLGIVPFGLVAGVTAVEAGLSPLQAVGMSVVVFAGASQLAAIELLGRTAPATVVVLTALVINLRFVMYSASLAPYLRRLTAPARWVSAYVLTDQAYAVSLAEFRSTAPDERRRLWYYLGSALALWGTWQVATAVGAVAGAAVPPGLSLEFAVPLTFLALLVPAIEDRTTGVVAAVSGGVAAGAVVLPFDLGLVTAALVGVALGVVLDTRAGRFPVTEGIGHADADDSASAGNGGDENGDDEDTTTDDDETLGEADGAAERGDHR